MKTTRKTPPAKNEEMIRITYSTPQKQITHQEQHGRQELAAGIECLIADFQSRHHTDVVGIELYPL
jgi:hypothetical protein